MLILSKPIYNFNIRKGATGVGKSATIAAASRATKNRLIRFNMSSRITIDDLLGKVVLCADENVRGLAKEGFQFLPGPFTQAFRDGYWLLLDELNLAQDTGK